MPEDFFQILRGRYEQYAAARSRRMLAHWLLAVSTVCLLGALEAGNSGEPLGEFKLRVLGAVGTAAGVLSAFLYMSAYRARRASRAKPEDLERALEDH